MPDPLSGQNQRVPDARDLAPDVLVDTIVQRLASRRLACAESCTGGLLAQTFAKAEGSAEWFPGGVVTYQKDAKVTVLGLAPGPVVTHAAARAMAIGAARLFGCEVAVSITGAAGPEPLDGAAPGTVYVGTFVDGDTRSHLHRIAGSPDVVCHGARDLALRDLLHDLGDGTTSVAASRPSSTAREG